MANSIQLSIDVKEPALKDQLIAELSNIGFDAFEENDESLQAFINQEKYNTAQVEPLLNKHNLQFNSKVIEDQNWNAVWESNFQPVVVEDFCAIRAHFHQPFNNVVHDIVITPKMSFGTGHHATTYQMVREMSKINFQNKQVADFGTGTGVLAILADKMGAAFTWAIDYDDWSIENASENIQRNSCLNIQLEKADQFQTSKTFDIIVANINRNVILDNVPGLVKSLHKGSKLLLSGLLTQDEADIVAAFKAQRLTHLSTVEKNNWICILFEF